MVGGGGGGGTVITKYSTSSVYSSAKQHTRQSTSWSRARIHGRARDPRVAGCGGVPVHMHMQRIHMGTTK